MTSPRSFCTRALACLHFLLLPGQGNGLLCQLQRPVDARGAMGKGALSPYALGQGDFRVIERQLLGEPALGEGMGADKFQQLF